MSCPSGYFWNGGVCSSLNTQGSSYPLCLPGWYYHPPSCMCVQGVITRVQSSCGSSQIWNGVGCSDAGMEKLCPAGSYFSGVSCRTVNSIMITLCSANQFWNGQSCSALIGSGRESCSQGYYFKPYKSCLENF